MNPMENERSLENFREKEAELREFRAMDREAVDYIGKEFRGLVSEETLAKMRNTPSEFKTHEELAKAYTELEQGKTAPQGLEGFSKGPDIPAQICSDHRQTINEVVLHERLHQAANPGGASLLGNKVEQGATKEGVTQALTERMQADISYGNFYPEETKVAKETIREAGPSAVENLYFKGDASELNAALKEKAHHDARLEALKKPNAAHVEELRKPQG